MFWDTFFTECKNKGTSPNAVCKEIGLSNATATGWKNGTLPKADVLCKIADYLNVSVDYLLGRELPQSVPAETFSPTHPESNWVEMLSKLDDDDLKKVQSYIAFLAAQKTENESGV